MIHFYVQIVMMLLVVLFAWARGGNPERHVALILFGMLVASTGYAALVGHWTKYYDIPWFRVGLDIVGFLLILWVALYADRWWPLWVASGQLLSVIAHFLRLIDAQIPPLAYAVMEQWPFWMAIVITGLGTYLHARRKKIASAN